MVQRPVIVNIEVQEANTEYSQRVPKGTRQLSIQTRDGTAFRFAFESGHVAKSQDPFYSVWANLGPYAIDNILAHSREEIFVACPASGKVVELLCWCDTNQPMIPNEAG
jgi:hypothetical protein